MRKQSKCCLGRSNKKKEENKVVKEKRKHICGLEAKQRRLGIFLNVHYTITIHITTIYHSIPVTNLPNYFFSHSSCGLFIYFKTAPQNPHLSISLE
ncbi:hypothetical protein L6452_40141 [Arctium lappa]|uniref:Uncharacterized protein n=1 Tax=Arctium lappa TaxID=4217 RepID=A0ACB8XL10_ARCLA|nr:hypothetical protein L6452_40141 [Arctium lappa]